MHPQTAPSLRRSPSKSNTPIPSPTPLTTLNGIRIQSAVLPQYACADSQTGGRHFSNISALLAILIESDALKHQQFLTIAVLWLHELRYTTVKQATIPFNPAFGCLSSIKHVHMHLPCICIMHETQKSNQNRLFGYGSRVTGLDGLGVIFLITLMFKRVLVLVQFCSLWNFRSIAYKYAVHCSVADTPMSTHPVLFLADRTIGRAFVTICRLSVCRLSVCLSSVVCL